MVVSALRRDRWPGGTRFRDLDLERNGQNYSVNISELKETTIIKINKKIIPFLIVEFENFGESNQNCRVLSKN